MKSSTYIKITLAGTVLALFGFIGLQVYVDPLFHYHAPTEGLEYPLFDERYMNDGIIRHFDYDSIITGTSMTENFKTSIFDALFGTKSIKVPYSGATYKEINSACEKAFASKDNIKMVMRGLDLSMLLTDKDIMGYQEYPEYLYDDNLLNDYQYVLNKDLFVKYTDYTFEYMRDGGKTIPFDAYKFWAGYDAGKEKVLNGYTRRELNPTQTLLSDEDRETIIGNLEQNVLSLVKEHPETEFYFFIPPYSIVYWDDEIRQGYFERDMEMQELLIDMLVPYENVHLFSHFLDVAVTTNLGYYIDSMHYNYLISDRIIYDMAQDNRRITAENKQFYLDTFRAFYSAYDYDSIYE